MIKIYIFKWGGEHLKKKKEFIKIACPSSEIAVLEGLIDLLVIKNIITEKELVQTANLYGAYINALIDLLVNKKIFEEWELDICIKCYHDSVRALANNPNISPEIIFDMRRKREKELIEVKREMMK